MMKTITMLRSIQPYKIRAPIGWILLRFLIMMPICALYFSAHAYESPIGIPDPGFGIDITYRYYDSAQHRNPLLEYRINAEGGYYTHYVNRTVECTDNGNPYGDQNKPRCSLPTSLPAGSVVEIHGNGYTPKFVTISSEGTAERPTFIRGISLEDKPDFDGGGITLSGAYYIVENIELYRSEINIEGHHGTVRYCYIHGQQSEDYTCDRVDLTGSYHVLYQNEISYQRRYDNGWVDCHGVQPGCGSEHIWVLENHIHHNSGDAFQTGNKCDGRRPRFIYVGRNIAHEDRENAYDTKHVDDIVISQNVAWGYNDASSSDGTAIIIGSDGAPNRAWVIFNTIHDAVIGIRNEDSSDSAIVGNVIYDIDIDGIKHDKDGWNLSVVHNTIVGAGHSGFEEGYQDDLELSFEGNIVANLAGGTYHFNLGRNSADFNNSVATENLFFQNGDAVRLVWNDSDRTYSDTLELSEFPGGSDNIMGDPLFVGAADGRFNVAPESAAAGISKKHHVYDEFNALYGLSITYDFNARPRPAEGRWTAGAFEASQDGTHLSPPTNLRIIATTTP